MRSFENHYPAAVDGDYMKIVYLIMAHQDPNHLKRLVDSLNDGADFYIHIDKKVDEKPFRDLFGLLYDNVKFIEKRINVCWGGYTQVEPVLQMMKAVIDSEVEYDRVIYLTGADYPAWSNQRIKEEFTAHPSKQYINAINITKSENEDEINKIRSRWYYDIKIKNNFIKRIIRKSVRILLNILPRRRMQVYLGGGYSDVYFGFAYWSLTYDCIKFIYETIKHESKFVRYMKFSFAPCELFAETILFNSAYKEDAIIYPYFDGERKWSSLHYMHYSGMGTKILTEEDFENIVKSDAMFFMKANSEKSSKLIELINQHRGSTINCYK